MIIYQIKVSFSPRLTYKIKNSIKIYFIKLIIIT